jgi:hypothetical protein
MERKRLIGQLQPFRNAPQDESFAGRFAFRNNKMNDCPRRYSWKESGLSVSFNHSETPRKMKVLRGVLHFRKEEDE